MPKRIDLTNKRFGQLIVLSYAGKDKFGKTKWLCLCDCGNEKILMGTNITNGHTKSCGCYRSSAQGAAIRNHRLYSRWKSMIQRCENQLDRDFKNYGGRGICVCPEWQDPHVFMDWAMANGYADSLTIDRIDNNGNYCPENCRFVTQQENNNNRRVNLFFMVNGIKMTATEAARNKGIAKSTLSEWVSKRGFLYAEQRLQTM